LAINMENRMRFRTLALSITLATSALSAGCQTDPYTGGLTNETTGTVGGAAVGAIAGAAIAKNDVAGALLGAAIGGVIGNRVGANMDEVSRRRYFDAQARAFETGSTEEWNNEERGDRGRVSAGREYYQGGQTCRPYESEVWISGRGETMRGTACRNPDGSWGPVQG
jgi:surface antigen